MILRRRRLVILGLTTVILFWLLTVVWRYHQHKTLLQFLREPTGVAEDFVDDSRPIVYVFEEHQEALFKWYNFYLSRDVDKKNLVLIHIDAHSDLDIPVKASHASFPLSHYPKNVHELAAMLHRNDDFILSAAFAGLFNKYLHLTPDWVNALQNSTSDSPLDGIDRQKFIGLSKAGFYWTKTSLGITEKGPCSCSYNSSDWAPGTAVGYLSTPTCYLVHDEELQRTSTTFKECIDNTRRTLYNVMSPMSKMVNMDSGDYTGENLVSYYLKPPHHYILDIDLDFFAVELPSWNFYKSLNKSAENFERLSQKIDVLVEYIFCVTQSNMEEVFNSMFHKILDFFGEACLVKKMCQGDDWKPSREFVDNLVSRLSFADSSNSNGVLCPISDDFNSALKFGLHDLRKYVGNKETLDALKLLGVCYQQAPVQQALDIMEGFRDRQQIVLCVGKNSPFLSAVTEFFPSKDHLDDMLAKLLTFCNSLNRIPDVVTICRSSRDGYAPRRLVNYLQLRVLSVLQDAFGIPQQNILVDQGVFDSVPDSSSKNG